MYVCVCVFFCRSLLDLFPLPFRVRRWRFRPSFQLVAALLGELFLPLFLPREELFRFLLLFRDGFVAGGEQLLGGFLPFAV